MHPAFVVGEWRVEPSRNALSRGEGEVRLEPKVMALLVTLASRSGQVVVKEELIAAVWQDAHVSDSVLTTAVYQLRRVLGNDAIETIPRRGYRLRLAAPAPRRLPRRALIAVAALAAFAVLALVAWQVDRRRVVGRELSSIAIALIDRQGDLDTAAETLERVAAGTDDPRIWGSLAYASVLRASAGGEAAPRRYRRAVEAGRTAVGRAPRNSDARIALALVALWRDWRWDEAERQLALAGPSPRTEAWRAYLATLRGRGAAARSSLAALSSSADTSPDAALTAATTALLLGSFDDAETFASIAAARGGAPVAVRQMRRKIADRRVEVVASSLHPATVDAALTSLERALAKREHRVLYLNVDRRWDHLRDHPRFRGVLRSAGL